ncbi:MAG TPA: PAS domain S-box protein [Polyangiaceae bacterium]|nr:PAS domain S-box protein [Polyangiaceae bacterium]
MLETDPDRDGISPQAEGSEGVGSGEVEALGESGDRLRLLVESVVDYGIFMLDLDGRISSWNAGAERMNGYTTQEILGKHFSIFYSEEEVASGKCERELEIAEQEGRFEEEGWRIRKDGTQFWANVVITAVRNREGRLVGYGKVTRDLTTRRRAEEALRTSEERLRLLVASVKDYAIFILDRTGRVTTWNPGAERLKGYLADEIIGRHFSVFYPEEDVRAGKCEMELEGATAVGRFEDEGWRLRKDGSRFWANVVISTIRDANGVLVGFAKVTRDLSERKRHEDERIALARAEEKRRAAEESERRAQVLAADLRHARDKAEEATRLKDDFLATVSHELRTPLNAILGWTRMLHAGSLGPEKSIHAIETILRNATAQNQIIDDLLDVSRIIAGQLRLEVDFINICEIVSSAIEVVRPGAEAKGLTIHAMLDPSTGMIKGDAGRLQQVLWNLLTNAVKFTPRGGRIHITLRRENSSVEIDVADTGKGVTPDFLPRMFERFTQQEASKSRSAGGLGLGLAIVKHLVELHGGTVEAHSNGEGAGTTFIVRLPLAPVYAARRDTPTSSVHAEDLKFPSELGGLKVLVIDDEPDARELVQAVLAEGGAQVTLASSAAEAFEMIRAQRPDVIVSDIGMPDEDGYVFIRKLRELSREEGGRIPAVALTAYARAEDRRNALLAGFQNHAAKPIEPQELLIVIANLAGRFA